MFKIRCGKCTTKFSLSYEDIQFSLSIKCPKCKKDVPDRLITALNKLEYYNSQYDTKAYYEEE